jgi:hypothetical protein
MKKVWCPGCGCDVGDLVNREIRDALAEAKAIRDASRNAQSLIVRAVRDFRSALNAIEQTVKPRKG